MTLESAIALASEAHSGQVDKGGQPYILHPLRVMFNMATDEERIVAVLHDVMEDCAIEFGGQIAAMKFSSKIVDALEALFKAPGEKYHDYIERLAINPLARKVKLADLWDNMNLNRLKTPLTEEDLERHGKYKIAYGILSGAIHG